MSVKPNTDYSKLAEDYDAHRTGYSADLYSVMADFGLAVQGSILDVACGTGLASEPLAKAGARITGVDASAAMLEFARARFPQATWIEGSAEDLPFEKHTFDGAICAQAFHWLEREKAIAELIRVVKRSSVIAIWWKHMMNDDPTKQVRDDVVRSFGIEPPESGLKGGFVEFYRALLRDHTLRVIPWRVVVPLERYMGYERSRHDIRDALGGKIEQYLSTLQEALLEQYGSDEALLSIGYLQFLYLGRTL